MRRSCVAHGKTRNSLTISFENPEDRYQEPTRIQTHDIRTSVHYVHLKTALFWNVTPLKLTKCADVSENPTLIMKAADSSETSVCFYEVTRCHTPSAKNPHSNCLISHWMYLVHVRDQWRPLVNGIMNSLVRSMLCLLRCVQVIKKTNKCTRI